MRLVNQIAEADVNSMDGMLRAHPATVGVADGTSCELPACRLRRVTQYIQENLQRELRLSELSALVHMSPYHFARLFKRSTGVPPHKFLVRRRIDAARALLEARTLPTAEIARLVGFRTPSHFTTTFRRITGTTPSAYRGAAGAARVGGTSVAATS
jgi:AraC family transcriptional regulator